MDKPLELVFFFSGIVGSSYITLTLLRISIDNAFNWQCVKWWRHSTISLPKIYPIFLKQKLFSQFSLYFLSLAILFSFLTGSLRPYFSWTNAYMIFVLSQPAWISDWRRLFGVRLHWSLTAAVVPGACSYAGGMQPPDCPAGDAPLNTTLTGPDSGIVSPRWRINLDRSSRAQSPGVRLK